MPHEESVVAMKDERITAHVHVPDYHPNRGGFYPYKRLSSAVLNLAFADAERRPCSKECIDGRRFLCQEPKRQDGQYEVKTVALHGTAPFQKAKRLPGGAPPEKASEWLVHLRLCRKWAMRYAYPGSIPATLRRT